jgi:putative peptide zinc metalloprotease protein
MTVTEQRPRARAAKAPAGGTSATAPGSGAIPELAAIPGLAAIPELAPGVEFFGEYLGSGYTEPHYLVRRADGQVVQLTKVLDLLLRQIDGQGDVQTVADRLGAKLGQTVAADDVEYLLEHKLVPAGIVLLGAAPAAPPPRANLMLAVRLNRTLIPAKQVQYIARALSWLHDPPVVALVLLTCLAFDAWLFTLHGAAKPLMAVIDKPVLLLAVLGLTLLSLLFHEFGHASACRYSGARPGRIGCGIYLIWPSLYTDVTDVYRVGRTGRLRTDLGGVYFNVVFILGLAGCYAGTGQPLFLAAALAVHFEILDQLLPVVRLDGYFILTDLAGVPDLFGRIRPTLASVLPGRRRGGGRVGDLRRGARITVTAWVLLMVPLIGAELAWVGFNLPRLLHTTVTSVAANYGATRAAVVHGQWAEATLEGIGVVLLVVPAIGLSWLAARVAGRAAGAAAGHTGRTPRGRHLR